MRTLEHTLSLDRDGCAVVRAVLSGSQISELIAAVGPLLEQSSKRRGGVRSLLTLSPAAVELARSAEVRALVEPVLGAGAFVTRSILFDKSPDANWDVVWHQDTTIAVNEQHEVEGFGPWSTKAGIPHVQPPREVLAGMLTVRIHLDDCGADNGPLLVVPGSHHELVADAAIDRTMCDTASVALCCRAGDVILMRPLILHASRKSVAVSHRRVIHLEFASVDLPAPLQWARI